MRHTALIIVAIAIIVSGSARRAYGQGVLTYPGCNATYKDADFKTETLVKWDPVKITGGTLDTSLNEPVKLAVGADAQGNVEVYFVELRGALKVYRAADKSVHTIGKVAVETGPSAGNPEQGLMGVALDPKFAVNRRIYLYHSVATGKPNGSYRITRYTLSADRLSMAEPKTLIDFPVQYKDCCHTGGGMQFDDLGDLWFSVGNNEGRGSDGFDEKDSVYSGEWGSSSTASLRGGVSRIHPKDDGTYSIPKGNFGEYWAAEWDKQGKTALAADYRNTAKVRPEIYVKGNRNPYGIGLDKVRRWVVVGDVGPDGDRPDGTGMGEDHDLYLHPAFGGWPYFAGNSRKNGPNWAAKDPLKPTNTSKWNKGAQELPPAQTPLWEEHNGASFGSTFYRYDKNNKSTVKLPAYFHKHFIWGNWSGGSFYVAKIDDNGNMVGKKTDIFKNGTTNGPTDIELGPDGAMYVVNYSGFFSRAPETRIDRIYYTGAQCDVDIPVEKAGCAAKDPSVTLNVPEACETGSGLAQPATGKPESFRSLSVTLGGSRIMAWPHGIRRLELYDMRGRLAFACERAGDAATLRIPEGTPQGLYQALMIR